MDFKAVYGAEAKARHQRQAVTRFEARALDQRRAVGHQELTGHFRMAELVRWVLKAFGLLGWVEGLGGADSCGPWRTKSGDGHAGMGGQR
jgi:hypothetical protein